MEITDFPHELFLLVISYLSPQDCVLARRVSRRWLAAFTGDEASYFLLQLNFPRCRELRLATAAALLPTFDARQIPHNLYAELQHAAAGEPDWPATFAGVAARYEHLARGKPRSVEKVAMSNPVWPGTLKFRFHRVAPWLRFLRFHGKDGLFHYPDPFWWYSQEDGLLVCPTEPPADPPTTGQQDQDLDSASFVGDRGVSGPDESEGYIYQLVDLETRQQIPVPFDMRGKVVRRVRIAQGTLIFEWAESVPYHQLNEQERVHRHFVTAFDVVRHPCEPQECSRNRTPSGGAGQRKWSWDVKFRSEWKLHFLGLPLNNNDRFFSTHTATHYAVYIWQPNRSTWGEDDPIEQVAVWDISQPSSYRPSQNPHNDWGKGNPGFRSARVASAQARTNGAGLWGSRTSSPSRDAINEESNSSTGVTSGEGSTAGRSAQVGAANQSATEGDSMAKGNASTQDSAQCGPTVIRRMTWRELGFYEVRQGPTPQLRSLGLDDRNLYLVEEEHCWAAGQHRAMRNPRLHFVKSVGIPVIPAPAPGGMPSEMGDVDISTQLSNPVQGPRWYDACGADGSVIMTFCCRVRSCITPVPWPYSHVVTPYSTGADTSLDYWQMTPPHLRNPVQRQQALLESSHYHHDDRNFGRNRGHGFSRYDGTDASAIATTTSPFPAAPTPPPLPALSELSSSRWPGCAPCWRHEDFPYLTVSEMVDFGAGVRVTARHCFMLEAMSDYTRPLLCVKAPVRQRGGGPDSDDGRAGSKGKGKVKGKGKEKAGKAAAAEGRSSSGGATTSSSSGSSGTSTTRTDENDGEGGGRASRWPAGQAPYEMYHGQVPYLLEEVQFGEEMWDELLAVGHIAGDERWVIGQDTAGQLTIVRF